jgi:predicted aconitase
VDGIIEYVDSIQRASRLKVTYLINNTNMSYETTAEDVIRGQKIIREASERLGIPVRYTCIREDLAQKLPEEVLGDLFTLKMYMKPAWLE